MRYRVTPLDLPLALFVGAEILAIVFSVHPARSLRCLRGDWILLFFPVFAQAFRSRREVERAFRVLLVSSTLAAAYAVYQMFSGRDLIRDRTLEPIASLFIATGAFGHHLTYGGHILLTSVLAFAFLAFRPSRAAAAATILQAGGLLASFARTAWIGAFAGMGATILMLRGRTRRWILAGGGAALLAALALPVVRERIADPWALHDDPRIRLWRTALRIWWDHPIFGAGLGSFKTQFPLYKVPGFYMATGHPHNDFLNILVHSGIVGLAAFLFIGVRYGLLVRSAQQRLPAADPARPLLRAALVVPLAFLVGAMGQCFLTDEEVGTLFWFLIAGFVAAACEGRGKSGRTVL
jgi:O-antigen ligase